MIYSALENKLEALPPAAPANDPEGDEMEHDEDAGPLRASGYRRRKSRC